MARRQFEIGGDTTPELTNRIASGKAGTPTVNSTWQTVVTWLESVLGFLKTTSNLSDLNNTTTARTNLGVYSTTQVDAALNDKADKTNVLEKDNTTTFTPTSNYNPATKKYVDDGGLRTSLLPCIIGSNISDFDVKAIQVGGIVYVKGQFRITSSPGANTIFTLPLQVNTPIDDWPFIIGDAVGASSELSGCYIPSGTRTVKVADSSISGVGTFSMSYPANI